MKRLRALAFAGLFLAQILPAATLAWRQEERLTDGRPIVLAVTTRDPRDLFRGDYSVLAYEISRLDGAAASNAGLAVPCDLAARESCSLRGELSVYVRLAPDEAGVHRLVDVSFERPPPQDLFIVGKLRWGTLVRSGGRVGSRTCEWSACLSGQVRYGVENWYGPQGVPAQLDRAARKDVLVEARVGEDGTAALDGIRVGGERFARTARFWR